MPQRKHSAAAGRQIGSSLLTVPVLAGIVVLTGATAASAQWGYRDYYDPYRYDDGYHDPYRYDDGYYDPYRDQYLPRRYQRPRKRYRNPNRNRRRAVQRQKPANIDLAVTSSFSNEDCTSAELCTVEIQITNNGPKQYKGPLKIRNQLLASQQLGLSGIGPQGWECQQRGSDTYCQFKPGGFQPGQTISLELAYQMPSEAFIGELKNCTSIQWGTSRRTNASVAQIQRALAGNGYNPGPIDGRPGRKTRDAILRYQRDNGIRATGIPTNKFLNRLFRDEMTAGLDLNKKNDRACSTIGTPQDETDRYADEQPQGTDGQPQDAEARAPDADETPSQDDAARPADTARQQAEDEQPEEPTRRARASEDEEPDPTERITRSTEEQPAAAEEPRKKPRRQTRKTEEEPDPTERITRSTEEQPAAEEQPRKKPRREAKKTEEGQETATEQPKKKAQHGKALSRFHRKNSSDLHNSATSELEGGPEPTATTTKKRDLPRVRKPVEETETAKKTNPQETPANQHLKWKSDFHKRYESSLHEKKTSEAKVESGTLAPLKEAHAKAKSDFHKKSKSELHAKATSGAVSQHAKWKSELHEKYGSKQHDKATTRRSSKHDKGTSAFHQKYKSVQHSKQTTKLSKVHSKDVSRVVHSKAKSAITNPDFQGEVHDKGLSRFHKKFTSSTHDKKITKAPVSVSSQ